MDIIDKTDEQLQEKKDKSIKAVKEFLDNAREGVLAVDEEGIILYINDTIGKLFQKEESEMIGRTYKEVVADDSEAVKALETAHMQTLKILAETQSHENELTNKLKATQKNLIDLITTFVKVIESHDPYMQGHSARVARYAMILGKKLGLVNEAIQNLAYAGLFHDLGMLMVPKDIIHKATSLSIKEWVVIKRHPLYSIKYIENIDLFKDIIPIIKHHHERWDGEGYPSKIKGSKIPSGARILFVAEAFDALTSKRPYRKARTREEAISTLAENSGSQFDPTAVENFIFLLKNRII